MALDRKEYFYAREKLDRLVSLFVAFTLSNENLIELDLLDQNLDVSIDSKNADLYKLLIDKKGEGLVFSQAEEYAWAYLSYVKKLIEFSWKGICVEEVSKTELDELMIYYKILRKHGKKPNDFFAKSFSESLRSAKNAISPLHEYKELYSAGIINAFSEDPNCGHRILVVPNADKIKQYSKIGISTKFKCKSTVFLEPLLNGSYILSFLNSRGKEIENPGSDVFMAAAKYLIDNEPSNNEDKTWTIINLETKKGTVKITVNKDSGMMWISQGNPKMGNLEVDKRDMAALLGIEDNAIADNLPIEMISLERSTLLVPLTSIDCINEINPDFSCLADMAEKNGINIIYPYALNADGAVYSKQLSLCNNGRIGYEHNNIGFAAGALGVYLQKNKCFSDERDTFLIRQKVIRKNTLNVYVMVNGKGVFIGGFCNSVQRLWV